MITWRRRTVKTTALLIAVLLCPLASRAADQPFDIKPGLWNVTATTQMSGAPPIPNLDQLTPEQRARIEAAMKNMAGSPQTITRQTCVTREAIEKAIADANSNKDNKCAPRLVSSSPSKVVLHIDCTQEKRDVKSSGDIIVERQDSEHFKGTGAIKITSANGRTMDMKSTMTGTFVSSDCGNVKPSGQ
jgi:hypothetical protein